MTHGAQNNIRIARGMCTELYISQKLYSKRVIQVLVTVSCPLHCSHCTHSAVLLVMLSTLLYYHSTVQPRASGNLGESCLCIVITVSLWFLIPGHDILHSSDQGNPFIPSGAPSGNNTDNIISIRHNLNTSQYWHQDAADNITSLEQTKHVSCRPSLRWTWDCNSQNVAFLSPVKSSS